VGCSGTAVARPSGMALQWLGQLALVAAASAACLTSTPALAEPVSCEKEPGYVGGPYVANRQVAIAIFKAIADTIAPDQVRSHPVIAVEDEGDHWSVWRRQRSTAPAPKANEVIVTMGGGGLGMSINKCTGTVSEVAFSR